MVKFIDTSNLDECGHFYFLQFLLKLQLDIYAEKRVAILNC